MILSLIGQPSARASGVCLLREEKKACESVGIPQRHASKQAGLPLMECGSWLGVHREAGLCLLGSVEIQCWTVLGVCVYNRFMVGDKSCTD